MTYVLDTNVVSALRVPGRNPAVAAWADSVEVSEQFIAATTLAEIERGVIAKERTDPAQGNTYGAGSTAKCCPCSPTGHWLSTSPLPARWPPTASQSTLHTTMR